MNPADPNAVTVDVDHEMSRLRDFQRATANYAFDRMFGENPTSRFLVADEVGLGKTLVARGVIAKAIAHLQAEGDERIDIVYICSNQAIAQQNLRKLAPDGLTPVEKHCRLSLLPFEIGDVGARPVNLVALTPGTSLKLGNSGGTLEERAAILGALLDLWGRRGLFGWVRSGIGRGVATLFAGDDRVGAGDYASKEDRIIAMAERYRRTLSDKAQSIFAAQLEVIDRECQEEFDEDLRAHIRSVGRDFHLGASGNTGRLAHAQKERRRIIKRLREAMATTGAHLLQPDVVVLDEFQRFRDVLHGDDDDTSGGTDEDRYAATIAKHLLSFYHDDHDRHSRVLLLSATPYTMHTAAVRQASDNRAEHPASGTNEHYEDFLATYRFLAQGLTCYEDPIQYANRSTKELARELFTLRQAVADSPDVGIGDAVQAAEAISNRLRQVMARTERLAATADRDGMLTEADRPLPVPDRNALEQYLSTAEIIAHYHTVARPESPSMPGQVVSYWKAAPYTLSFLDSGYQVLRGIEGHAGPDVPGNTSLITALAGSPAVLPWTSILEYGEVPASNAALKQLWDDLFTEAHAERLLWLPSSLPYYRAGGDFETEGAQHFTKRLIFSAWNLAPTAIATLTSYECERRLTHASREHGKPVYRYDDRSRSAQLLRFRQDSESMPHLLFDLVFPALADLVDPLRLSAELRQRGIADPTLDQILERARELVQAELQQHLADQSTVAGGLGSANWYPLAPLLMSGASLDDLLHQIIGTESVVAEDDSEPEAEKMSHLQEHLATLRELANAPGRELPPAPADLTEMIALAGVAGPPSVIYRALRRSFPDAAPSTLIASARLGSDAFRRMLNSPNSHQVINVFRVGHEGQTNAEFWRKALLYCAVGNLQAVMDEYIAAVVENRGFDRNDPDCGAEETAKALNEVLGFRTAIYQPSTMIDTDGSGARWTKARMRGGFAVRLVDDAHQESAHKRGSADVSAAFNSPFWPFVLASTSVGQEGLDFHLYSHAVSHWNLPTNPVDMEQREGRVHRYKCHAVRKNVARTARFPSGAEEPWRELFDAAHAARVPGTSDIVPYWVYAPSILGDTAAKIERHLPIAPYTREMSIKGPLLASVSVYRMAFGQPRQDEFIKYVLAEADEQLKEQLSDVRINLSP